MPTNNLIERADGRDAWETPDDVYEWICKFWGYTGKHQPMRDVCASPANAKCLDYITAEQNALTTEWESFNKVCWMNPPYSEPLLSAFIDRAIEQSRKHRLHVIFLLPDWTDRKWFDRLAPFPHAYWRDPQNPDRKIHRVKFNPPPGIKKSSPRYGNIHGVIHP